MRTQRRKAQSGQAAVEFLFAMMGVIALAAGLFQVLHFELDVFNKMGILRSKSFSRMHYNNQQYNNDLGDDSQTVSFKTFSQLVPYTVPFQSVSPAKYPDKKLYYKRGTQFCFPGGAAASTGFLVGAGACMALADHYEDSAGNCKQLYNILLAVPVYCAAG